MGEAAEKHYGCNLCLGPPTDDGFFYEMSIDERYVTPAANVLELNVPCACRAVVPTDYASLETLSKNAVKEKQKFERLVMSKEDLLEMFHVSLLSEIDNRTSCKTDLFLHFTVQQVQEALHRDQSTRWNLDHRLSMRSHDRSVCWTAYSSYRADKSNDGYQGKAALKCPCSFQLIHDSVLDAQSSASYWLNDANNDSLQRIYGISFPDTKQLTEYKAFLAEAAKRDHRKIGKVRDQLLNLSSLSDAFRRIT